MQFAGVRGLVARRAGKRRTPGPAPRLAQAVAFLEANREDLVYFYPDLFAKCLSLWEEPLNYPYFKKLVNGPIPPENPYRRCVLESLHRGRQLIAHLR